MSERDKFLTVGMGECWHHHEEKPSSFSRECRGCGKTFYGAGGPDFSTWEGFGKLWEWAIEQDWWFKFKTMHYLGMIPELNPEISIIHPDLFATALYEYLTSNQKQLGNLEYHMSLLKKETP